MSTDNNREQPMTTLHTWETETFKQIEKAATIGKQVEMMFFHEEGRFKHLGLTTKEAFRIYQDGADDRAEYERNRIQDSY